MGKMQRFLKNIQVLTDDYGLRLALGLTMDSYLRRGCAYQRKVKKYLDAHYTEYLQILDTMYEDTCVQKPAKKVVWVLWWQGENNMPDIVKACRRSVFAHRGEYEVKYLSSDNVEEYIQIPKHIKKKFNDGMISLPHMSDYIRVSLLREYGGMWIDATVFVTADIPCKYIQHEFFSRHLRNTESKEVAAGRWSGYFFASKETHSYIFELLCLLYEKYWMDHNRIITYLLPDYLIDMIYRYSPKGKKIIDSIPVNNTHMKWMQETLNNDFCMKAVKEICSDTVLHKLSHKVNISNNNSLYYAILNDKLHGGIALDDK